MTKFLTVLTSAILALLLIAIGFFLVRDKPTPTEASVGSVAAPSYEAVVAPPESFISASAQRIGGTSGAEGRGVVLSSGGEAVPSRDGEGQSIVDKSQTQGGGIDRADLLSLSADPATGTGEEEVGEIVEEPTPELVEPPPGATVSLDAPIVSDSDDPATELGDVSVDPLSARSTSPGTNRAADLGAAVSEVVTQDRAVNDEDGAQQAAVQLPQTYTMRRGDTLSSIAERYYGNPALWKRIRDANREVLGKGVRQIPIGAQLTIPPLDAR